MAPVPSRLQVGPAQALDGTEPHEEEEWCVYSMPFPHSCSK